MIFAFQVDCITYHECNDYPEIIKKIITKWKLKNWKHIDEVRGRIPLGSIRLGNIFAVALKVKGGINRHYANMQFMQNAIYVKINM